MSTLTGPTPNQMPGAAAAAAGAQPTPPAPGPTPAPAGSPAPAASAPAAAPAAGAPATGAASAGGEAPPPPWEANGETFDPARAWNLIQELRAKNTTQRNELAAAQPILAAAEEARRAEQGELTTMREDRDRAAARETAWRAQAVRATASSLAAGRFVDAETALALIGDLSEYATDDAIDTTRLQARLDQLAQDKPFLVAAAATPPAQGFTPNRGQGQSGNTPLTPAQTAAQAESQQDWRSSNAAKAQQLLELRKP